MTRIEFLAFLASPALTLLPEKKEPEIAIFVGGKKIGQLTPCKFTPYRMTAKNIKVSKEFIDAFANDLT
jgi:hypothetical protein